MSQSCEICGRGTVRAHNVSHSQRKTLKLQKINLQTKVVDGKRKRICTQCIKKMAKTK